MFGPERRRQWIVWGLVGLIVLGALVFVWRAPRAGRVEVLLATPAPITPTPAASLRVYVCGAVAHPDVYLLAPGSIVKDAIQAAGGATDEADLTRINLAIALTDQMQVYVPARGEPTIPTPAPVRAGSIGGAINLNTATAQELESLPGIGPALAGRIISRRPFRNVEELLNVPGIGPATYEKLKGLVVAP